jgi:DNA mismatch repair protein MutS2
LARAHEREQELEREVRAVRASADRAREDAMAEAQRELAAARAELNALRDELRSARRVRRESDQDRALGAATERATRAERALGDLSAPLGVTVPLAEGDPVESDVGVRGTIASIRGDEAEVVGATGQRVRISLARLRPSRDRVPEDRTPVVQVRAAARGDASDQLDVRGLPGQEAREEVRRLVDDAALAGLDSVRVVHGRGTGALRKAVREELSSHPLVERRESDAEDGATIAYL